MIPYRSAEYIRGMLAAYERDAGWYALIWAAVIANAQPHAIIYRIAEHSTGHSLWVAAFLLLGVGLLMGDRLRIQAVRFAAAVSGAMVYGIFAAQAWSVGAKGAGGMGLFMAIRCVQVAARVHRRKGQ